MATIELLKTRQIYYFRVNYTITTGQFTVKAEVFDTDFPFQPDRIPDRMR
jgi:hypothetical protein